MCQIPKYRKNSLKSRGKVKKLIINLLTEVVFIKKIYKFKEKWAIFGLFFIFLLILAVFFTITNIVNAEIIDPTAQPPGNNTSGFIQISDINQGKQGPLRLGTSDIASKFNYQLEVLGEGADTSQAIIDNDLKVSNNVSGNQQTLYVDSLLNKVCIGTCTDNANSKLEISGTGAIFNNAENSGNALSVYSNNDNAIFGSGDLGGIYSLSTSDKYSIYGLNTSGTAVEGSNIHSTYSSVAGFSDNGIAIYGTNVNSFSLWSAYFNGRFQANTDISAAKIISKNQANSLIGYTVGQQVESYDFGDSKILYHDGTYIWLARNDEILKIRASDNFQVFKVQIGNNISSMIYDGKYYWAVYDSGVVKIDPENGNIPCSISLSDPRGIAFTGLDYWVTQNGNGTLVKINNSCVQIGTTISLVNPSNYDLGKVIFDGNYLWALASNNVTSNGVIININPSTGDYIPWGGIVGNNPVDIYFDNYYYWVLNSGQGTITRFHLNSNKVCSKLTSSGNPFVCSLDSDCSSLSPSLGQCGFSRPQNYGYFIVSSDNSHVNNSPTNFVFTDKDIWVNNIWTDDDSNNFSELVRMPLYDPSDFENFELNGTTNGIAFDQTYLWISSSDSDLVKIFSGTGYGHTDMTDTLLVQNNSPLISQWGSFNISGESKFGINLNSEGNLKSENNSWGATSTDDIIVTSQWELTGSLPASAGQVLSLLMTSNDVLLAGDRYDGHISRSVDRGANWADVGGYGDWLWAIFESHNGVLFAAVGDESGGTPYAARVMRSADEGLTWQETATTIPTIGNHVYTFTEVYENGEWWLYAGAAWDPSLYKTHDEGATWTSTSPLPGGGDIESMVYTSDNYLYAVSKWNNNVDRTNDGGLTWQAMGDVPGVSGIYKILEASDGNLYVATGHEGSNIEGRIFRSTNDGYSWTSIADFSSDNVTSVYDLKEINGVFYAVGTANQTNEHIYRSIDFGTTWTEITSITGNNSMNALTAGSDGTIYIGGGDPGVVYRSTGLGVGGHSCPNGHFVKNIKLNDLGQVIRIECSSL